MVVIGGGDVAIDAARSSLRLGAEEVTLLYRRSREEMPADPQEVREAEEEDVQLRFLVRPNRFLGVAHLMGIELQPMVLGPPEPSGRRRPVPERRSPLLLPCDTALVAVSQEADLTGIPSDLGARIAPDGVLVGDPPTGATRRPGVYVAGGVSVVHAMAAGKRAALAIDDRLSEARLRRADAVPP